MTRLAKEKKLTIERLLKYQNQFYDFYYLYYGKFCLILELEETFVVLLADQENYTNLIQDDAVWLKNNVSPKLVVLHFCYTFKYDQPRDININIIYKKQ